MRLLSQSACLFRESSTRGRSASGSECGGEEGVEEQQPSIHNPLPGPDMRTAGFRGAAFPPLAPTADRQDK